MLVTMDMCSVKAGSDYTTEVMCAGWNPEIAMMQDRAVELAEQLIQMGIPLTHVAPVIRNTGRASRAAKSHLAGLAFKSCGGAA